MGETVGPPAPWREGAGLAKRSAACRTGGATGRVEWTLGRPYFFSSFCWFWLRGAVTLMKFTFCSMSVLTPLVPTSVTV